MHTKPNLRSNQIPSPHRQLSPATPEIYCIQDSFVMPDLLRSRAGNLRKRWPLRSWPPCTVPSLCIAQLSGCVRRRCNYSSAVFSLGHRGSFPTACLPCPCVGGSTASYSRSSSCDCSPETCAVPRSQAGQSCFDGSYQRRASQHRTWSSGVATRNIRSRFVAIGRSSPRSSAP